METLEITPDRQRLLVSFRCPLPLTHAVIATIENPEAVFEAGAVPIVGASLYF